MPLSPEPTGVFHEKGAIPFSWTDERHYAPESEVTVFTWDIDKTYLATRTETASDLVRTFLEFAIDKEVVGGTVPLLKGIRRGGEGGRWGAPIYFVSASPVQMRSVLQRKMLLDGVQQDGIALKDQLGLLFRYGPRVFRRQMGYKLTALLHYRLRRPPEIHEILFGDNSESDPLVYGLYRRIVEGRVGRDEIRELLMAAGEPDAAVEHVLELAGRIHTGPYIRGAFIQATGASMWRNPPRSEGQWPIAHPLQAAIVLENWGEIDSQCVQDVAGDLLGHSLLNKCLEDGERRGLFSAGDRQRWERAFRSAGL